MASFIFGCLFLIDLLLCDTAESLGQLHQMKSTGVLDRKLHGARVRHHVADVERLHLTIGLARHLTQHIFIPSLLLIFIYINFYNKGPSTYYITLGKGTGLTISYTRYTGLYTLTLYNAIAVLKRRKLC